ncbi:hypothetical protein BD626DRAFT_553968 [Schizophyllum amplum]|uniref:Mmc1 C-terminal domain-containing protein n=1 Tax=Schizophyllum amplum TaxID=97359 RepID=A0A550CXJ2_9AGAR|nr:hypothetical protein BD626DRAFT_553968 [Auriculariopsis ampla]
MPCRYSGLARLPAGRASRRECARRAPYTCLRLYTDAAAVSSQDATPQQAPPRPGQQSSALATIIQANAPYRTLVTKTQAVVLDVLPRLSSRRQPTDQRFWDSILKYAIRELDEMEEQCREGKARSPLRVLVCGVGEDSGARELVTALTEEPFSSSKAASRWENVQGDRLQIRSDGLSESNTREDDKDSTFVVSSPWLNALDAEVFELRRPLSSESASYAFRAHVPIIVRNPAVTSDEPVPLPIHSPLKLLILNAPPRGPLPDHPTTIAVDTQRAAAALETLNANPGSPAAVQLYQHDFAASNIQAVFDAIRARISALGPARRDARRTYVHGVLLGAFAACHDALANARSECETVEDRISALERRVEEYREAAPRAVLQNGNHVTRALEHTERRLTEVLDRLTWWRMVSRVDEVSNVVADAVERLWCTELEQHLVFHTGRLAAVRAELEAEALGLVSPEGAPFASAVLRNDLASLAVTPSTALSPVALTGPVHVRRAQMVHYATPRLHAAGQRSVLLAVGGAGAGSATAIASWFASLGVAESVLNALVAVGMTPTTATGAGILVALASVRVAMGRWEKAKRRWWGDWKRVSEGLERDLKSTLDTVMRQRISAVPDMACKGVLQLVEQRREAMAVQDEALRELEAEQQALSGEGKKQ